MYSNTRFGFVFLLNKNLFFYLKHMQKKNTKNTSVWDLQN